MKKTVLFTAAVLMAASSTFAKDVVYLKDGSKVKGDISQITEGQLTLARKNITKVYTAEQVSWIKADNDNQVLKDALKATDPDMYEKGRLDASKYHKRTLGNGALGFFFGPFGLLGVALGGAKAPDVLDIKDDSLMKNEDYRHGYKKKAKGKNVGNAALGWAVGVAAVVLFGTL
jgi:hypothetical protein